LQLERFCEEQGIPFRRCGKLIVATEEREFRKLDDIHERGIANGVRVELIGPERIREIEPYAAGKRALWVPDAGVIEYPAVCRRLAALLEERGVEIRTGTQLHSAVQRQGKFHLQCSSREEQCTLVINCAGLHSDRVARLLGCKPALRIIPFKGEYYSMKPEFAGLCRALIYPVTHPGFLKFSRKYIKTGLGEIWRSLSKRAFLRSIQRLVPEVRYEHLKPAVPGIRAQAISDEGRFVDDFEILEGAGSVNVLNAPSPAATSCLSLGSYIAERAVEAWRRTAAA
jgi:L-2-hydroxyglutarate oxidase